MPATAAPEGAGTTAGAGLLVISLLPSPSTVRESEGWRETCSPSEEEDVDDERSRLLLREGDPAGPPAGESCRRDE